MANVIYSSGATLKLRSSCSAFVGICAMPSCFESLLENDQVFDRGSKPKTAKILEVF